jgi:hypothetical protein
MPAALVWALLAAQGAPAPALANSLFEYTPGVLGRGGDLISHPMPRSTAEQICGATPNCAGFNLGAFTLQPDLERDADGEIVFGTAYFKTKVDLLPPSTQYDQQGRNIWTVILKQEPRRSGPAVSGEGAAGPPAFVRKRGILARGNDLLDMPMPLATAEMICGSQEQCSAFVLGAFEMQPHKERGGVMWRHVGSCGVMWGHVGS